MTPQRFILVDAAQNCRDSRHLNFDALPPIPDAVSGSKSIAEQGGDNFSFWDKPSGCIARAPERSLYRRSVFGAAWLPVDQAVRVSTYKAQLHNLSGWLRADIGDEISPSRRVRQQSSVLATRSLP
jgi:hypothetical protein